MNIGDTLAALKPYAGGAVGGAAAIAIIAFSADWVVTAGTLDENVQKARVSALAEVCETNALAYWKEQGNKPEALDGWDNEKRTKLAKQFAPKVPNDDGYHDDVVDACDDALNPA